MEQPHQHVAKNTNKSNDKKKTITVILLTFIMTVVIKIMQ